MITAAAWLPNAAEVSSAATAFIEGSNSQDEIFVLNFNDIVRRGLPESVMFSDAVTKLRAALSRGVPEGRTALNDAIVDGLQQLNEGKRDKKTLVIITDGGDHASRHKRRQIWDAVERSIAAIYPLVSSIPTIPTAMLGCSADLPELPADNPVSLRVQKG